jgi:hypothetical protein
MKPQPVRKYASPKYPTRLEVAGHPGLLERHQPPAWRKWPELTGAAGLFLVADAARLSGADGLPKSSQNPAQANAIAVVAPVFQHGEGRGATGCIVMAPPIFLSEEEALQVIREEMASSGVQLGTNQTTVAGVTVKRAVFLHTPAPAAASTGATNEPKLADFTLEIRKEPFRADAADPKRKVFIEFLSRRNADEWELERPDLHASTVWTYDLTNTASFVSERVKQQATNQLYFGVFYDPMAGNLDIRKRVDELLAAGVAEPSNKAVDVKVEALANGSITMRLSQPASPLLISPSAESLRLLRLQVQDFLKWLQAQGAL